MGKQNTDSIAINNQENQSSITSTKLNIVTINNQNNEENISSPQVKIFKLINKSKSYKSPKLKKLRAQLYQKFKKFIKQKQQTYQQQCSSSSQFICPICLEMFLTPCPSSCGHIFCFHCIDQALIRKGNCPCCRNYIRNQEFIQSKPFSQMSHYFWICSKEKQHYLQKYKKNQEWLKNRRIDEQRIKINDLIDVRDTQHIWCKAKVLNIYKNKQNNNIQLLIHFEGWNEIYDEVINIKSQRLAPYNFFSQRQDIPRYKLNPTQNNMSSRIDYRENQNNHMQEQRSGMSNIIFTIENPRFLTQRIRNIRQSFYQRELNGRRNNLYQFLQNRIRQNQQNNQQGHFNNIRPRNFTTIYRYRPSSQNSHQQQNNNQNQNQSRIQSQQQQSSRSQQEQQEQQQQQQQQEQQQQQQQQQDVQIIDNEEQQQQQFQNQNQFILQYRNSINMNDIINRQQNNRNQMEQDSQQYRIIDYQDNNEENNDNENNLQNQQQNLENNQSNNELNDFQRYVQDYLNRQNQSQHQNNNQQSNKIENQQENHQNQDNQHENYLEQASNNQNQESQNGEMHRNKQGTTSIINLQHQQFRNKNKSQIYQQVIAKKLKKKQLQQKQAENNNKSNEQNLQNSQQFNARKYKYSQKNSENN